MVSTSLVLDDCDEEEKEVEGTTTNITPNNPDNILRTGFLNKTQVLHILIL